MNNADIGTLLRSEVDLERGFVWWGRTKTENVNTFKTCHQLWPETLALLRTFIAASGELALLGADGNPLYGHSAIGNVMDYVSKAFQIARRDAESKVRFKDIRQTGSSALSEMSGDIRIGQQFCGHSLPGMSKFYTKLGRRAFADMNGWIERWGNELRAAGVFNCCRTDKRASGGVSPPDERSRD